MYLLMEELGAKHLLVEFNDWNLKMMGFQDRNLLFHGADFKVNHNHHHSWPKVGQSTFKFGLSLSGGVGMFHLQQPHGVYTYIYIYTYICI